MRMFKALSLAAVLALSLLPAANAEVPATFSFSGAGYGHGVGMSQIWAKVRALNGESATEILNYYYKDVLIAPIVDTQTIRVNLANAVKTVSFVSVTTDSVIDIFIGDIGESTDVIPALSLTTRQKARFRVVDGLATFAGLAGNAFTIRWSGPDAVMTFREPGEKARYRY